MSPNKAASEYLASKGWIRAEEVVSDLIEGGFIEVNLSEPERIAQAAKEWLGQIDYNSAFSYASGWSTAGWEAVLKEPLEHNIAQIKNVFAALVILAKEAGKDFDVV